MQEVEIKLRAPSVEEARSRILAAGFVESAARVFERNELLDTPDRRLRESRCAVRVRFAGGAARLTYKGPPESGTHKRREELETKVDDGATVREIFRRLGYETTFVYEKYRTEFRRAGEDGLLLLDETPLGVFIELEGDAGWIDGAAAHLGHGPADYILSSYARLWQDAFEAKRVDRADMTFS
jgi:adenylate cyclase class 2